MKITRIVALGLIASSFGLVGGPGMASGLGAQPAEYPPSSYKGRQYVDSRGCVFIRAGIDGNVNWVPRVNRSRKQLCGFQPTPVAGSTPTPSRSAAPELITLPAADQPGGQAAPTATTPTRTTTTRTTTTRTTTTAAPAATTTSAAPARTTTTKPQREVRPAKAPTTRTTTTAAAPAPAPRVRQAAPVAVAPAPAPQVRTETGAACPGLSGISAQYTNQGARCGPQDQAPVTFGSGIGPQSSLILTPNTRVVPAHVYQDRRHSQNLTVPEGYRTVWTDDRLNPHRAERTLAPAVIGGPVMMPAGYVPVDRDDNRLSTHRAVRTSAGDAQMAAIWTNDLPRELVPLPLDRATVTVSQAAARSPAEAEEPMVLRLSTRSAPQQEAPKRSYVRAATYADEAQARAAARDLARQGLPVRLGSLTRGGQRLKVVLAGPFAETASAEAALAQVQAAGFSGARLSR